MDDERFVPTVPGPIITWYRQWSVQAGWQGLDRWGDTWSLRGAWSEVDRQAPPQWKTWLGDMGTLRGYEAAELVGDRGGWSALDVRWNVDPLGALHVPLLGRWGLQPVTFVEVGRTRNRPGRAAPLGDAGTRTDAGLGSRSSWASVDRPPTCGSTPRGRSGRGKRMRLGGICWRSRCGRGLTFYTLIRYNPTHIESDYSIG